MIREQSRTKNSMINILTGFGGQLISLVLKFVCRTIFIKTLSTSYLGINGLFSDILSMLSLAELGFDTAISYRLYKPIAENDDKKIREYIVFFKNAYRIIGIIIFGLGLLIIPMLKYLIKDYDSLEILGINAGFIFLLFLFQNSSTYFFGAYRSIIVKADQKQYLLDIVGYFITICRSIAEIVILLLFSDFTIYIITITIFFIIQNLLNAYVATKHYPEFFVEEKSRLGKKEKIELYKDCGALLVYKINNVVIKATDNIVLSYFIGLTVVGLYSNYLVIYGAINSILNTVFISVKASMGNLFTSDDIEKKYSFFEIMNFVAVVFYGTAAIGVSVVCNEVIEWWLGIDYVIKQPLPILIGIEILFTGIKLNLAQIRHVSGVFKQMWFRPVVGSGINVISSIVLVHFLGVSGVVLGTIFAAVFANFLIDPIVIHKYSFNNYRQSNYYYKKNLMFILVLLIIGGMDYLVCTRIFVGYGIASIIIHFLICAISVPIGFISIFWNRYECIYLRNKLLGIIKNSRKG